MGKKASNKKRKLAVVEDDSYMESISVAAELDHSATMDQAEEAATQAIHTFLNSVETLEGYAVLHTEAGTCVTSRAVKVRSASSNYALLLNTVRNSLNDDLDFYTEDVLFDK